MNIYTAAQEAEEVARRACAGDGYMSWRLSDATLALCLAAAAACKAVAHVAWIAAEHFEALPEPLETDMDCARLARALMDDYTARAVEWRKMATGGET